MYQSTYEKDRPGYGAAFSAARIGSRVSALLCILRTWQQRSEERRALSQLGRRQLEDAGITSQQLYEELRKPFWRA